MSGGDILYSGNFISGITGPLQASTVPAGGVQLVWSPSAAGNAYVALSGGITVSSGGLTYLSGFTAGSRDGLPIAPGGSYFVPKSALRITSGNLNIWVSCDAAASGTGRMFFELL